MSKIVTITFIADNDYVNTESLRQHFFDEWDINASVSAHDYPDRSELSKWDRLDAALPVECKDSCCNQAV